jgi:hypothetical protein
VFPPREAATEFVVLALAELGRTGQLSLSGLLAAVGMSRFFCCRVRVDGA